MSQVAFDAFMGRGASAMAAFSPSVHDTSSVLERFTIDASPPTLPAHSGAALGAPPSAPTFHRGMPPAPSTADTGFESDTESDEDSLGPMDLVQPSPKRHAVTSEWSDSDSHVSASSGSATGASASWAHAETSDDASTSSASVSASSSESSSSSSSSTSSSTTAPQDALFEPMFEQADLDHGEFLPDSLWNGVVEAEELAVTSPTTRGPMAAPVAAKRPTVAPQSAIPAFSSRPVVARMPGFQVPGSSAVLAAAGLEAFTLPMQVASTSHATTADSSRPTAGSATYETTLSAITPANEAAVIAEIDEAARTRTGPVPRGGTLRCLITMAVSGRPAGGKRARGRVIPVDGTGDSWKWCMTCKHSFAYAHIRSGKVKGTQDIDMSDCPFCAGWRRPARGSAPKTTKRPRKDGDGHEGGGPSGSGSGSGRTGSGSNSGSGSGSGSRGGGASGGDGSSGDATLYTILSNDGPTCAEAVEDLTKAQPGKKARRNRHGRRGQRQQQDAPRVRNNDINTVSLATATLTALALIVLSFGPDLSQLKPRTFGLRSFTIGSVVAKSSADLAWTADAILNNTPLGHFASGTGVVGWGSWGNRGDHDDSHTRQARRHGANGDMDERIDDLEGMSLCEGCATPIGTGQMAAHNHIDNRNTDISVFIDDSNNGDGGGGGGTQASPTATSVGIGSHGERGHGDSSDGAVEKEGTDGCDDDDGNDDDHDDHDDKDGVCASQLSLEPPGAALAAALERANELGRQNSKLRSRGAAAATYLQLPEIYAGGGTSGAITPSALAAMLAALVARRTLVTADGAAVAA